MPRVTDGRARLTGVRFPADAAGVAGNAPAPRHASRRGESRS